MLLVQDRLFGATQIEALPLYGTAQGEILSSEDVFLRLREAGLMQREIGRCSLPLLECSSDLAGIASKGSSNE